MTDLTTTVGDALLAPVTALFDPSKRVFGPFLLGGLALGFVTLVARGSRPARALRAMFSPRVWLHRSSLVDLQLVVAKAALQLVALGSFGLSSLAVAGLTAAALRRHFGVPELHASALVVGALYTLATFVFEDWGRYALHKLMHRVPALWAFHKVHHSAEVLTPFSLYRTHPVEALLNASRGALTVGLVTGLFSWAFGPALRAWEVLGVDAVGFAWTLLGANLRHSHVWLSYGPRLERFFVSPAQHQVHHSADPRHFDRNFGTVLAVWDWLGGSLYTTTRTPEALAFGLAPSEAHPGRTALALLTTPFVHAARELVGAGPLKSTPRRAVGALALASVSLAGCTPAAPTRVDRMELLRSFGRCTIDTYGRFQTAADALATATAAHATAPNEATRAAARTAWEGAIDVWQSAELLRYGPAADFETLGGRGLRQEIYAWPDVNRCLIEQQLVSRSYESNFASISSSARGLAAVEYLLFHTGTDNACPADNALNATGTWAAISPDELARRKAAYARAAAADVAARGRELTAAWDTGGFLTQLTTAGHGSALFATQQGAISAVAEASFYLDTDTKDLRLGRALGLSNCPAGSCPEALESRWADRGKRHLRNNLAGLRVLMEGCSAGNNLGFDDLLDSAGASALTTQLRADIAAAEAAVDAIPGDSLSSAFASDRASLERAHAAIRELTGFLKMEFSTTLQIRSQRVEGDND